MIKSKSKPFLLLQLSFKKIQGRFVTSIRVENKYCYIF